MATMGTDPPPRPSQAVYGRSRAVQDDSGQMDALGATTASPDGDSMDDARVVAISLALQEHSATWVRVEDGEVQLDTEVAALIALATLDEGYCSAVCHDEEYNAIVEFIREFEPRGGKTDCSCRDEILQGIETAAGVATDVAAIEGRDNHQALRRT